METALMLIAGYAGLGLGTMLFVVAWMTLREEFESRRGMKDDGKEKEGNP